MQNDKEVKVLDPWDPNRTSLSIKEVCQYLQYKYAFRPSRQTIMDWVKKGAIPVGGVESDRVYLKMSKFNGTDRRFITKADLLAFLNHKVEKKTDGG